MKHGICSWIGLMLVTMGLIGPASGKIIYVKASATGLNNGTSWTNAYKNLQSALAGAHEPDEIWVAKGTYKPTTTTDRFKSFAMPAGVALYGGFSGNETARSQRNWTTNATILSGDIGAVSYQIDNSVHIVTGAQGATVDGVTIRDGYAIGAGDGAGLHNGSNSMTIANCSFLFNSATLGGAVYNAGSSQTINDCTFTSNTATIYGGGIYNQGDAQRIANCLFKGNKVDASNFTHFGGAIYNTAIAQTITNSTFIGNIGYKGGGVWNRGASLSMAGCTFRENNYRGAIGNSGISATLVDCTIICDIGGGILNEGSELTVRNCIINGTPSCIGSAGINNSNGSVTIDACTFSSHLFRAIQNFGRMQMDVMNCTFSDNSATVDNDYDAALVVTQSRFIRNGRALYNAQGALSVSYCTFFGNSEGAISNGGPLTVSNCIFTSNSLTVTTQGAAIYDGWKIPGVRNSIANCVFDNNSAATISAVVTLSDMTLTNCVFTRNSAFGLGSTLSGTGKVTMVNCTFAGNWSRNGAAVTAANLTVSNSVFWGNTTTQGGPDFYVFGKAPHTALYKNCIISQGGQSGPSWNQELGTDGGGNMNADPLFVEMSNPAGPDRLFPTKDDGLRLKPTSPCVNKGLSTGAPLTDIIGYPRENGVDIGAYEFYVPKNGVQRWIWYR